MAEDQRPGFLERLASHIGERLQAIPSEVAQTVTDKVIPQGAAELSQAINSQADGYVPYGTAQRPLEVEGPQQSYQDMLREAASRAPEQEKDRDLGMDR